MKCEEFQINIRLFFSGMLDDEGLSAFSDHIVSCDRCERAFMMEYQLHNELQNTIDSLPQESPALTNILKKAANQIGQGLKGKKLIQSLDKAFDDLRQQVLKEAPNEDIDLYVESLMLEAFEYIEDANLSGALKCLTAAIELRPENVKILKVLGGVYLRIRR